MQATSSHNDTSSINSSAIDAVIVGETAPKPFNLKPLRLGSLMS